MNKHIFYDRLTAYIASIASDKHKFFSADIESPGYLEHLKQVKLRLPVIQEGVHEVTAETLVGQLDPAFYVAQLKGHRYPTIIYHHGNNERPFDFRWFAKNTFNKIFFGSKQPIEANLIGIRAPFHQSSIKRYQSKISYLSNFIAMLTVSVKLIEKLTSYFSQRESHPILVSGISLGGWIANLHRTHYNTADCYVPLLAGAALGTLFTESIYRKLTGKLARENPATIRERLNFEVEFMQIKEDNVFPLLGRYDQFIEFERQKICYGERPINILEKGHITSALANDALRQHIVVCLKD